MRVDSFGGVGCGRCGGLSSAGRRQLKILYRNYNLPSFRNNSILSIFRIPRAPAVWRPEESLQSGVFVSL